MIFWSSSAQAAPQRQRQLRWLAFLLILTAAPIVVAIIAAALALGFAAAVAFTCGCCAQLALLAWSGWRYFGLYGAQQAGQIVKALKFNAVARYAGALLLCVIVVALEGESSSVAYSLLGYIYVYIVAIVLLPFSKI